MRPLRSAVLAALLRLLLVALLAAPALAYANPRLSSLHVQMWPEFDRRAMLVIINGELAPDTTLPAQVSLRIPSSSGGPVAVAYSNAPGSQLLNLPYEVTKSADHFTLRFSAPQRFIHVEYYDMLATGSPERRYTYVWPGDLPVDRLIVTLQEPAEASAVSALPDLGPRTAGADGLYYRTLELGAYEAGKQLPVEIRYTKPDPRTSSEILKPAAADSPATAASSERYPAWVPLAAAMLGISVSAPLLWWLWRRRTRRRAGTATAGFCTRCGNALGPDDRYCSSCGARVQRA